MGLGKKELAMNENIEEYDEKETDKKMTRHRIIHEEKGDKKI